MKKTIAIICGGKSPEHEISIRSVKNVIEALDRQRFDPLILTISKEGTWYYFSSYDMLKDITFLSDKKLPHGAETAGFFVVAGQPKLYLLDSQKKLNVDAAFPILHGNLGEDGTLQGLIRMMNLPLVGCDVLAGAVGMDKEIMKRLFQQSQIPTPRFMTLIKSQPTSYRAIASQLGEPFFIKPANAGSSVGVHKIKSEQDFTSKLKDAFLYDQKVLAEEFVDAREIECSVIGHTYSPKASLPGEVIAQHEFYSYEAKYLDENGAITRIPAELDAKTTQKIQDLALRSYQSLLCEGMTRVDFFLKKDGEVMVNELNTIPGFTNISMYPKMWEASGLSYTNLITKLIDLAFEKHQADQQIATNYLNLSQ